MESGHLFRRKTLEHSMGRRKYKQSVPPESGTEWLQSMKLSLNWNARLEVIGFQQNILTATTFNELFILQDSQTSSPSRWATKICTWTHYDWILCRTFALLWNITFILSTTNSIFRLCQHKHDLAQLNRNSRQIWKRWKMRQYAFRLTINDNMKKMAGVLCIQCRCLPSQHLAFESNK